MSIVVVPVAAARRRWLGRSRRRYILYRTPEPHNSLVAQPIYTTVLLIPHSAQPLSHLELESAPSNFQ